jgi:hypothetical protein
MAQRIVAAVVQRCDVGSERVNINFGPIDFIAAHLAAILENKLSAITPDLMAGCFKLNCKDT